MKYSEHLLNFELIKKVENSLLDDNLVKKIIIIEAKTKIQFVKSQDLA